MFFLSNKNGSLLIELLVSIAILGLMATISVPYIRSSISNFVLTSAAKEIITDLNLMKQKTVSEQTFYYVQFIEDENKYRLMKESTETILEEKVLPENIIFDSINNLTENKAKFNYFGAAFEAGTIILKNTSTNITFTINIRPAGYINYN